MGGIYAPTPLSGRVTEWYVQRADTSSRGPSVAELSADSFHEQFLIDGREINSRSTWTLSATSLPRSTWRICPDGTAGFWTTTLSTSWSRERTTLANFLRSGSADCRGGVTDAVFPHFSCALVSYVRTNSFPSLARRGFSHDCSRRRLRRTVSCSTSHSSASTLPGGCPFRLQVRGHCQVFCRPSEAHPR